MKFRTEIEFKNISGAEITHSDTIWTIGSCFADEIGDRMLTEGFDVEVNPLGTLYNPLSILRSVGNLISGKSYEPKDFFEYEGKFRNFDFHSTFAKRTAMDSAEFVNQTFDRLRGQLADLSVVMLTFGSSRCFRLAETGEVVANCHKQHPSIFNEEDVSLGECTEAIGQTIELLKSAAPKLRHIILTVSPIRHKAYGLHADHLSKSRLLLAVDEIENKRHDAIYFPSYEIMMDDLRDYRFYAADMVHPSPVAVDYIYEKFTSAFYSSATLAKGAELLRAFRRTLHRPIQ